MKNRADSTVDERMHGLISLTRPEDGRAMKIALAIAVGLHALVLMLDLPELARQQGVSEKKAMVIVRRYIPPPPPLQRPPVTPRAKAERRIPIPDPTPDAPEPIVEPDVTPVFDYPIVTDADIMIGDVGPPPTEGIGTGSGGPLIIGVGGVTEPQLIAETHVRPQYPEVARLARAECTLILQAIITKDGRVIEPEVMRCPRPSLGFEQAAMDAVTQWRYRPATQNGKPVEVYFTIVVDFHLL